MVSQAKHGFKGRVFPKTTNEKSTLDSELIHHYLCIRKDCMLYLTLLLITEYTETSGGYPKSFLPLIKYRAPPELTFCDPLFRLTLVSCVADAVLGSVLNILLQFMEKRGASFSPMIPSAPPFDPFPTIFLSMKSFFQFPERGGSSLR